MNSALQPKKVYTQPSVEYVSIDNEISLILGSVIAPGDAGGGSGAILNIHPDNNQNNVFLA